MTQPIDAGRRPKILVAVPMLPDELKPLEALGELIVMTGLSDPAGVDPVILASLDAVVSNGVIGFSKAMFAACPNIRIVHALGAGQEAVDVEEASRRGIFVSSGKGANADSVADHALGLALALLREIPRYDREVHAGTWKPLRSQPQLSGKSVGVLGIGEIGMRIARRAEAFDTEIHYMARAPKPLPAAWKFEADARSLAAAVDVLFLSCPGDASTHHIVDAAVLAALGKGGVIVNVSRGSVVDTPALIDAVRGGVIGGAALDVVEGEPAVPAELISLPNVVITPHVAGASPDARVAMVALVVASLEAAFAGRPPANRVA